MWFLFIFVGSIVLVLILLMRVLGGPSQSSPHTITSRIQSLMPGAWSKNQVRWILGIVAIVLLFIYWEAVKFGFTTWFVNSDANAVIGADEATLSKWFFALVIGLGLIVFMAMRPRKAKKAIGGMSFGDSLFSIFGFAFLGFCLIPVFLLLLGLGGMVIELATGEDKIQRTLDIATGQPVESRYAVADCNLREYLDNNGLIIPSAGAVITLCPGDGRIYIMAEHRQNILASFEPNFAQRNEAVLSSRFMTDFFILERGGGTVNSYVLTINDRGFSSSGLRSAQVFFRSVP